MTISVGADSISARQENKIKRINRFKIQLDRFVKNRNMIVRADMESAPYDKTITSIDSNDRS